MPVLPTPQTERLEKTRKRIQDASERMKGFAQLHDEAESDNTKQRALRLAVEEAWEMGQATMQLIDDLLEAERAR